MRKLKFHLNTDGKKTWLSIDAQVSEEEIDRLTPHLRLFLADDDKGRGWILNVPISELGIIK